MYNNPYKDNYYLHDNLNIVIPLAGKCSRFIEAGYNDPKPFIRIFNKTLLEYSITTSNIIGKRFIFLCRKEHKQLLTDNLHEFFYKFIDKPEINYYSVDVEIITVDETTEGAACTALLAKEYINNDDPLCIYNSDQIIEWNANCVMNNLFTKYDDNEISSGLVLCIYSLDPSYSFVSLGVDGFIERVAEKQVISEYATTGHYIWTKGRYFVESTERMIKANDRYNNEFYIAPTINYLPYKTMEIVIIPRMICLGSPIYVKRFIDTVKKENKINE